MESSYAKTYQLTESYEKKPVFYDITAKRLR